MGALRLAKDELFKEANGGRPNIPDLLILLTDGTQTPGSDAVDPGDIAEEIRKDGIPIIVIGIGAGTDVTELDHMAGGNGKAYVAKSFDELIAGDFVNKLTHDACQKASVQ